VNPTCETLVVTCIDFRLQQHLDGWLATHVGHGNYDRVSIAGGVKNWEVVIAQIEIAIRLHRVQRVILMNHEDCGTYGWQGTVERHKADLAAAQQQVWSKFPTVTVETYLIRLDGSQERCG